MERVTPTIIAGPCVIESAEVLDEVARTIVDINAMLGVDVIFKASFDKANRTSLSSYRGVGLERGLQMLTDVKSRYGLRLTTDIHEAWQAEPVGEVVDVVQIPALLSRQTDLIVTAARHAKVVNIKKGQMLSGHDMGYAYRKAMESGAKEVWLTERGNMFGYNNLVVDFRNIATMRDIAPTVIMDCTHSVQQPGACGSSSGGDCRYIEAMALAAKAFGANGYFFEVHPTPERALCDGANSLHLSRLRAVIERLIL
ncbi:MAG: 3-deoxy-8-phosphooctulonate synthase [Alistipes sp.]|nr:3-deoxy-8-phosphooctulonate synthase [Alistipes sp.]